MASTPSTVIEYPESDGKPIGETDLHRDAMVRHIELLKQHYQGQEVYVSGDLLVYYEEGNPKKFIVPDAFIVKGLKQFPRRTFQLWNEKIAPQLVIETTSRKTRQRDQNVKPSIYAQIGVHEYFIFDPTSDYLNPPLQGYRLVDGAYVRIATDAQGALPSQELGLQLMLVDGELEFIDPDSGQRLLTAEEGRLQELEARQREVDRRIREAEARKKAEDEVVLLKEQIRKLQGGQ